MATMRCAPAPAGRSSARLQRRRAATTSRVGAGRATASRAPAMARRIRAGAGRRRAACASRRRAPRRRSSRPRRRRRRRRARPGASGTAARRRRCRASPSGDGRNGGNDRVRRRLDDRARSGPARPVDGTAWRRGCMPCTGVTLRRPHQALALEPGGVGMEAEVDHRFERRPDHAVRARRPRSGTTSCPTAGSTVADGERRELVERRPGLDRRGVGGRGGRAAAPARPARG